MALMAGVEGIDLIIDFVLLILSLMAFFIFIWHLDKFAPGEAKKIFVWITVFLGMNFLAFLTIESFEISSLLGLYKGKASENIEETVELVSHLMEIAALAVLLYAAVMFAKFSGKLEKIKKG